MHSIRRIGAGATAVLSAASALVLANAVPAHATCEFPRSVAISDARLYEGTGTGYTYFGFAISTSGCAHPGSVSYSVAASSAGSGDFVAAAGTFSWAAGDTANKYLAVKVVQDASDEPNELFNVNLSVASGWLSLEDSSGLGTILDDDGPLTWNVDDKSCVEGGSSTPAYAACQFKVSISKPAPVQVSTNFSTGNGSAVAPGDYVSVTNQPLSIGTGGTTVTGTVWVRKDLLCESNEALLVFLSSPSLGSFADGLAKMTITNDDYFC